MNEYLSLRDEAEGGVEMPEFRVALDCARVDMPPETAARLADALRGTVDWPLLTATLSSHGLLALAAAHWDRLAWPGMPADVRNRLGESIRAESERSRMLVRTLLDLLRQFSAAGLDLIPYKGPVLGQLLYGHYVRRRFGDLDFLVRPEDRDRASAVLTDAGWRRTPVLPAGWEPYYTRAFGEYEFQQDGREPMIELHWMLAPRFLSLPFDIHPFWDRHTTVEIEGTIVPSLSPEDQLLVLCWHGTRHRWIRLAWLVDVAELLRLCPDLDAESVLRRARRSGGLRFLLVGLALARDLLDVPLPEPLDSAVENDPVTQDLSLQCAMNLFAGRDANLSLRVLTRFLCRARERRRDRWRYLWRLATHPQPDDWIFKTLPPSLGFLYATLRPWRLLRRELH